MGSSGVNAEWSTQDGICRGSEEGNGGFRRQREVRGGTPAAKAVEPGFKPQLIYSL